MIAVAFAALAGVWGSLEHYAHSERRRIEENAETLTQNVARLFEGHLARIVGIADHVLVEMRADLQSRGADFAIERWVNRVDAIRDVIVHVAIADAAGDLTHSSTGSRGLNFADRPHFRQARDSLFDVLVISEPVMGRVTGRLSVQLIRRTYDRNGSFSGVAQISLSPEAIASAYQDIDLGVGGSISILRTDGVKLAVSPPALEQTEVGRRAETDLAGIARTPERALTVVQRSDHDSFGRVDTFRVLRDYPLAVRVSVTREQLERAAADRIIASRLAGSALTIAILLACFSGFRFERRLSHLLRDLTNTSDTLQATLANVSQGIMKVDADGRIQVINDRMIALMRLPAGSLRVGLTLKAFRRLGQSQPASLQHLHGMDVVTDGFLRHGRWEVPGGGTTHGYEATGPDGICLEVHTTLLPTGGMVRTVADVSETRRLQEELRSNERFLEDVAAIAGVGGWDLDLKSGTPRWSQQTRRIHEVPPEYQTDLSQGLSFYPEHARQIVSAACERAIAGEPFDVTVPFVTAAGRARTVRVVGRSETTHGEVTRLIGAIADVTEAQKAAQEMAMLSELARQTTNGVVVTDVDGNVVWVNQSFERITGYTRDDMKGRAPGEILQGPKTDPEVRRQMGEALRRLEPFKVEIVNYDRRDQPYWVEISCSPLFDAHGRHNGFIAIETDIEERKQQEETIRRYADDLERFAHIASHDLQEPLRKIATHSRLLATALDKQDQDEVDRCLNVLISSAQRGRHIVTDLLRYSRLKNQPVERQTADLVGIVDDVLEQFKDASHPEISVLNHLASLPAQCDPGLITQVFQNVIGNAVKYRKKQQPVQVVIDSSLVAEGGSVCIRIADNGIGFDMAFRDRLFRPFGRLVTRHEYQGTGIGLSLVRSILEKHGWDYDIVGEPGVGTTFTINIPIADVGSPAESAAA